MLSFNGYHSTHGGKATWRTGSALYGSVKLCGIEFEHEASVGRTELLDAVDKHVNDEGRSAYYFVAESDGSLSYNGTEFVSNPIPYDILFKKDSIPRKLVRTLSSFRPRDQPDGVGIHFNLNGDAYTFPQKQAILWVFNMQRALGEFVGGRASNSYAEYRLADISQTVDYFGKYSAAWGGQRGRIEVRFCRSSIDEIEFIRRMLYVISVAEFASSQAKEIHELNKSGKDYTTVVTELYYMYMDFLKQRPGARSKDLFDWITEKFPIAHLKRIYSGFDTAWAQIKKSKGHVFKKEAADKPVEKAKPAGTPLGALAKKHAEIEERNRRVASVANGRWGALESDIPWTTAFRNRGNI